MKICLVNEFFRPNIAGGIELFFGRLANHLISKGFEVSVITNRFKNEKEYEKRGKLTVYRIVSSPVSIDYVRQIPGITLPFNFFNFPLQKKVGKIMDDCDCVHINNLYHLSFAPIQVANEKGKFVLLDVHDYWPVCIKKSSFFLNKRLCEKNTPSTCFKCLLSINYLSRISYPLSIFPVFLEYFLRKKFLQFNDVITHSKFVENIIEREFDIKPKMISYPYIGKKILGRKKVVKKKVDLLFMGRIDYLKGAHLLPEIASILEKKGIPYKIDVMGSGSMINKLKILSEKHRLKIQFHGFVNHMSKKFLRIMEDTHILLIPSLWYEPFGIVVLEAMAFGIPVIASNRGGLKEIVTENNVGILAYPNAEIIADEIENLIKDKKRYEKFSENGLKNIKKYKPENVFKEYEKIFEKVV